VFPSLSVPHWFLSKLNFNPASHSHSFSNNFQIHQALKTK
jgi:hypothetical protein